MNFTIRVADRSEYGNALIPLLCTVTTQAIWNPSFQTRLRCGPLDPARSRHSSPIDAQLSIRTLDCSRPCIMQGHRTDSRLPLNLSPVGCDCHSPRAQVNPRPATSARLAALQRFGTASPQKELKHSAYILQIEEITKEFLHFTSHTRRVRTTRQRDQLPNGG